MEDSRISRNALLISLVILFFIISSAAKPEEPLVRDFGERIKIVQMVADQIHSNCELLHTWKGRFEVEDESQIDGAYGELLQKRSPHQELTLPIVQKTRSEMQFAVDSDSDTLFTTLESPAPSQFIELNSGKEIVLPTMAFQQRAILSSSEFLFLNPNQALGQINGVPPIRGVPDGGGRVAIRNESSKGKNRQQSDVIDPRLLFGINNEPFWKPLEVWATWADRRPQDRSQLEKMISVRREGAVDKPVFVITITRPVGSKAGITFVSKSEAGFNVTEFNEAIGDGVSSRRGTWSYRKQGGVFVPEALINVLYGDDGRTVRSRRSMKLIESEVNIVLDKQTFTYAALGLKAGERVFDDREKAVYVFDGNALVKPELLPRNKLPQPQREIQEDKGPKWIWILVLTILVTLLTGIFVYRQYRRRME